MILVILAIVATLVILEILAVLALVLTVNDSGFSIVKASGVIWFVVRWSSKIRVCEYFVRFLAFEVVTRLSVRYF